MAGIRGRNTRPELMLRRALHAAGFRFRLHRKDLPGKPDIVMPGRSVVIFVHGCFWHRHAGCRLTTTPATRPEFWAAKFEGNVARDARTKSLLLAEGWRVAIVWECALQRGRSAETQRALEDWLRGQEPEFETAPD